MRQLNKGRKIGQSSSNLRESYNAFSSCSQPYSPFPLLEEASFSGMSHSHPYLRQRKWNPPLSDMCIATSDFKQGAFVVVV